MARFAVLALVVLALCGVCLGVEFTFKNYLNQPVNFQVKTAGGVFYVGGCNANPGQGCSVSTACVWYDLYAYSMKNEQIGVVKGSYCGKNICITGGAGMPTSMGEC
mmetsp:Transcript_51300/g.128735  ORF Transcript_51300/g.128735 Transcript_51300/m.128735 type:complete len:106 (+) Transcript_51300:119-436(+)|eukprot:CAMPEP_0177654098 /NCGR_PEP_ID=MMETSP0447-20121125/14118_1 /TAXON_ID=0 /ORGANISM="Stygamoeba regulata, Strain BSH-02190019" /LENGTH=105 /DNA_ID=CAMNT_0019157659 /DNA_START=109 /DNA_END=426 /DNA_ORIENTATION=+